MVIAAFMAVGIILKAASAVVALVAAVAIFMFNNRKLQSRMCLAGQLLLLLWVIYFGVMHVVVNHGATRVPFYLCLPIVAYIMFRMARAGIQHDEELIRSADRIR